LGGESRRISSSKLAWSISIKQDPVSKQQEKKKKRVAFLKKIKQKTKTKTG
jgi:hypothetical protein